MADSRIHDLTDGVTPTGLDEFVVARSPYGAGTDVKVSWSELLAAVVGATSEVIYDQRLVGPTYTIGPPSGGIPTGFVAIEAIFVGKTDYPGVNRTTGAAGIQVNADVGSNYYFEGMLAVGTVQGNSYNAGGPDAGVIRVNIPGASSAAGAVAVARGLFYDYDSTILNKLCLLNTVLWDPADPGGNTTSRQAAGYWNNAAWIHQLQMVSKQATTNNFLTGSRFTILGHK